MQDRSELIVKGFEDVLQYLSKNNIKVDVIFLDPPYETNYDIEAIKLVIQNNILTKERNNYSRDRRKGKRRKIKGN